MSQQTFHFIRHAQSLHNAAAETMVGDPMLRDAPLTDLGHEQARTLQGRMRDVRDIELVVISPLTRAIQTALYAFDGNPAPRLVMDTHREYLDHYCDVGTPPSELAAKFNSLDFDHLPNPWWYVDPASTAPYEKEPEDLYAKRIEAFAQWLKSRPEQRIAIVGHGNFLFRLTGHEYANTEVLVGTL